MIARFQTALYQAGLARFMNLILNHLVTNNPKITDKGGIHNDF
nr:MAG TPA: hypothetical protein [Caudoviricetes sp.]